jgi:uncharacterized beta-barrel protein YwiB (DUF1934 family)
MKKEGMVSIRGQQNYNEQEPETVELITEGILEQEEKGWKLTYEESDLTGLKGVTTTFQVEPGKVTLSRKGPLSSQMVFQEGEYHESLYQMDFGALMITVCANKVSYDITEAGGTIDLGYAIEIEQTAAGYITYHLDIRAK